MAGRLEAILRYFVPESLGEKGPDVVRQGRVVVSFALIIAVAGLVYAGVYVPLGMVLASAGALAAIVMAAGTAVVFRRTGDVRLSGHLLGFTAWVALVGVNLGTGSIGSPANAWFILCPVIPAMVAGRWAGVPWIGATLAFFVVEFALGLLGLAPPNALPPELLDVYDLIVPMGLTLALFAIAWSYEVEKDRALGQIRESYAALEVARDEARAAHTKARMVLDNVDQGLVVVRPDGVMEGEHSAALARWLGAPGKGATLWDWLAPNAPAVAGRLEIGWQQLDAGFLPLEVAIAQLPDRLELGERHLALDFRPVMGADEELGSVLVVISDITVRVRAMEATNAQQELMAIFVKTMQDRGAVADFITDSRRLVAAVAAGEATAAQERRWIHTLKGNSAVFGLESFAGWLHDLEDRMAEREACTDEERQALTERWAELERRIAPVLQSDDEDRITVDRSAFEATLRMIEDGAESRLVARHMRQWEWDPVSRYLERLADQTRGLAQRLGKEHVQVMIDAPPVRQPRDERWSSFWGSLVHVVRNALDHGIEALEEREGQGKPVHAHLALRAQRREDDLVVEICDDGRGIDWDAIASRARAVNLPADTHADRIDALFSDGVSTRGSVTALSGRGVGAGAVLSACQQLGGHVEVESHEGRGTCFRFVLPDPATAEEPDEPVPCG